MNHRLMTTFVCVALLPAIVATAQDAEWRLGGRALLVTGGTTRDDPEVVGANLELGTGGGLEFDAHARFSEMFGAEFTIGAAAQPLTVTGEGICCGGIDGGEVWLFPVTALAQFHIPIYGKWDPYLGVGIAWTYAYYNLSDELEQSGVEDIDIEGAAGIAAQAGVNLTLNNRWYANLDVRYVEMGLEARVDLDGGSVEIVEFDDEPWVFGIGLGCRF